MDEDIRDEDIMEEEESNQTSKKRKMSGGRIALIVILAVIVLLFILFFFVFRGRARNMVVENAVTSAEATIGDISVTIESTGTLQSGTVTDIDIPAGVTIDEVKVEDGDIVKKGDLLATVKEGSVASALLDIRDELDTVQDQLDNLSGDTDDPDDDAYLESIVLNAEYSDLKQAEGDLEYLLNNLKITATVDGTISGIAVANDTEVSAGASISSSSGSSDTASSYADALNLMSTTEEDTATLQFLTATEPVVEVAGPDESIEDLEEYSGEIQFLDDLDDNNETDDEAETGPIEIASEFVIPVTAPVTGEKPEKKVGEIKDKEGNVLVKNSSVTWDCSTETFQAGTAYTATIILEATDGYVFSTELIPLVEGATVRFAKLYNQQEDETEYKILYLQATFAATESKTEEEGNEGDGNEGNKGDGNEGNEGDEGNGSNPSSATNPSSSTNGLGDTSGLSGSTGSMSGLGSSADAGSVVTDSADGTQLADYNAYESTAFSLASGSDMVVTINVDELDILDVKEGQIAEITLDALEGQTFNGRITKVSTTAASTGGSAKYAVEITMNKTDDMMVGMNASATIYADEAKDVLTIPVSALQESGNTTFVYTQSDDEGNLSGEVEVKTGLSDGQNVEITSGLSAGDTVYYLASESTEGGLFNMIGNMGGGMGGGNAPDGGGAGGGNERGDRGGGGFGPFGN